MKFESPALDAYLIQEKITQEQKKHQYELWVLTFWIFLTDAVIYIRNSWLILVLSLMTLLQLTVCFLSSIYINHLKIFFVLTLKKQFERC